MRAATTGHGRLRFRPPPTSGSSSDRSGPFELQLAGGRGVAYAPEGLGCEPLRLMLMFHGAGGTAQSALGLLREVADHERLLVVALQSVRSTWDVIDGGYGPDVENVDDALQQLSQRHPVRGYSVGGFSDGASYALSIGMTNGDVFDSVVAFSPGFSAARLTEGQPRIFVSHGVADEVLPVDRCSRRLVPLLRESGYQVEYREFDGGHSVPSGVRAAAVEWLTAP